MGSPPAENDHTRQEHHMNKSAKDSQIGDEIRYQGMSWRVANKWRNYNQGDPDTITLVVESGNDRESLVFRAE